MNRNRIPLSLSIRYTKRDIREEENCIMRVKGCVNRYVLVNKNKNPRAGGYTSIISVGDGVGVGGDHRPTQSPTNQFAIRP